MNEAFELTRDRLLGALRGLVAPASRVSGTLPAGLADCLGRFFDLCDRVRDLGAAEGVPERSRDVPARWEDLAQRLEAMPRTATRVETAWETRRRALFLLDSVLSLTPRAGLEVPALCGVLADARSLRRTIAAAPLSELPREASALASADHPLALLLRLAALFDTLSDDSWEDARIAVTKHFGKPLWAALARGRITFNEPQGQHGSDAAGPTASDRRDPATPLTLPPPRGAGSAKKEPSSSSTAGKT
jgi:hypothetical protein